MSGGESPRRGRPVSQPCGTFINIVVDNGQDMWLNGVMSNYVTPSTDNEACWHAEVEHLGYDDEGFPHGQCRACGIWVGNDTTSPDWTAVHLPDCPVPCEREHFPPGDGLVMTVPEAELFWYSGHPERDRREAAEWLAAHQAGGYYLSAVVVERPPTKYERGELARGSQ